MGHEKALKLMGMALALYLTWIKSTGLEPREIIHSFIHSLLYLLSIKRKYLQSKYVVNEKSLLIPFLFSEEITGLLYLGPVISKLLESTRYDSCLKQSSLTEFH